jgi:hypothetical protein
VQGRLRAGEGLTFHIHSECAHCGRPLELTMDGALNYRLADGDAQPLMFAPDIDWNRFEEPNIIHAY